MFGPDRIFGGRGPDSQLRVIRDRPISNRSFAK
jgi:hypothetical protein